MEPYLFSGQKPSTEEGLRTLLQTTFSKGEGLAEVHGIGINCTDPSHLETLVPAFNLAMASMDIRGKTLLLYPNGGADWTGKEFVGQMRVDDWTKVMQIAVKLAVESGVWSEVMVGGCCETGPEHIRGLASTFSKTS